MSTNRNDAWADIAANIESMAWADAADAWREPRGDRVRATHTEADKSVEKYELSQDAYVLVLHHYEYLNPGSNRHGSDVDMNRIKEFFRDYKTEPRRLEVCENFTVAQVRQRMAEVEQQDFSANSCAIVILMSHGGLRDTILAHDGGHYLFEQDVVAKVASNRSLAGKPKLFIVNACRGSNRVTDSLPDRDSPSPHGDDLLIFQSTFEGHVSWRHKTQGSFFMQAFFDLLQEHDARNITDLSMLLNQRGIDQGIYTQNPPMTSTLKKRLIFRDLRRR